MVSKRTRIFGLINIFIYSTTLYLTTILMIFLFVTLRNEKIKRDLGQLNSEVGIFGTFLYALAIFGIILLFLATAILCIYVIILIRNYRKNINKNIIPYNFLFANLIVCIITILNLGPSLIFQIITQASFGERDILLILGVTFALLGPSSGILYSIFGMIDYKRGIKTINLNK